MNNQINISPFREELQPALTQREVALRAIAELVAARADMAYAVLRKYGYAPKDTSQKSIIAAISNHLNNPDFSRDILSTANGAWYGAGADPLTAGLNMGAELLGGIFGTIGNKQQMKLAQEQNKGVMLGFLAQRDAAKSAADVAAINAVAQKRIAEENRRIAAQDNKLILQIAGGVGFIMVLMGVVYFATRPPQTTAK